MVNTILTFIESMDILKIVLIFVVGFFEQLLYTAYLLSVTKRQVKASTILMLVYMTIYLIIIYYVMKDTGSLALILSYALSCGVGNYVIMKWEKRNKIAERHQRRKKGKKGKNQ